MEEISSDYFFQTLLLKLNCLCLEGEGEVRGIQLQHDTLPLGVTKFYTLNL